MIGRGSQGLLHHCRTQAASTNSLGGIFPLLILNVVNEIINDQVRLCAIFVNDYVTNVVVSVHAPDCRRTVITLVIDVTAYAPSPHSMSVACSQGRRKQYEAGVGKNLRIENVCV